MAHTHTFVPYRIAGLNSAHARCECGEDKIIRMRAGAFVAPTRTVTRRSAS